MSSMFVSQASLIRNRRYDESWCKMARIPIPTSYLVISDG